MTEPLSAARIAEIEAIARRKVPVTPGGTFVGDEYLLCHAAIRDLQAERRRRAPRIVADELPEPGLPVLVWWRQVAYADDGEATGEPFGGAWLVSEWLGGSWQEPEALNCAGSSFDDDYEFAEQPTHWMPLPEPPA